MDSLFFNTIGLTGGELGNAINECKTQNDRVLTIFKSRERRGTPMAPHNIWAVYCSTWDVVPLTSIRRAITCLTKAGKLSKHPVMTEGLYGKPSHTWVLSDTIVQP
jgi:hypothetical protein